MLRDLFRVMHKGGNFGPEYIEWFNGGLFDSDDALPLTVDDIDDVLEAAKLDWSSIEPSIFGTLFERGLDPSKRAQLGAHYTDTGSILRIVNPAGRSPCSTSGRPVARPSRRRWRRPTRPRRRPPDEGAQEAERRCRRSHRLGKYRVLDPACGSGNFLYLALQTLKDIEHRAALEAEELGMPRGFTGMNTGVQNVHGIELNAYAAELARLTVWIGEIQWMLRHGVQPTKNPILQPLQTIECRDAVLNDDGTEPHWPTVDAIIGNPPFLGDKKMRDGLGHDYTERLRERTQGASPEALTLSITGSRRRTLRSLMVARRLRACCDEPTRRRKPEGVDRIVASGEIFNAWSDEDWINEGAAVRVSIVCFRAEREHTPKLLDGRPVESINADLSAHQSTAGGTDLTQASRLIENLGIAFQGTIKVGAFDVPGTTARAWLSTPNASGVSNQSVVKPWANGLDVTRRPTDTWIVDFGPSMSQSEAAHFELPFEHVARHVRPERERVRRDGHRRYWWRYGEARVAMREKLGALASYLATPRVAKHRLFVRLPGSVVPDCQLIVFARSDDVVLGVLQCRLHELWSLRLGSSLEDRPRYTPTTTFETFRSPWPPPNLKPSSTQPARRRDRFHRRG
ncbi:MAG: N-6 DNA methylase [Anaerolineae bacterium]|nr:N-6 DNA methylase [Anaerolineae bacterium]